VVTPLDAGPAPAAFDAVTVTVYEMPFVRPVIVHDVPALLQLSELPPPAGVAVAVYPVTAEPPFEAGAVHDTVAWPAPGVAVTPVGAPGTVRGVAEAGPEAGPVPTAFVAVTVML
jgi:hypothetical protein